MGSFKAWVFSADGVFYIIYGWLIFLGFFGLALAGFIHYLDKKEEKEAEKEKKEAQLKKKSQDRYLKKRSKNRCHSQHKSNSEHHV
ncbi:hypothetical protein LCL85_00300 [Vibrio alginolyticus]|nr:hypothetical protein [Vibrio alginolyticus]